MLETRILAAEYGLRRPRVHDRDELDRNLVVAAREHERARIGEAHDGIVGADLPDGIDRALAAHHLHFEIGILVIAFLDGDEEIGMAAVKSEVGDQRHIVERLRAIGETEHASKRPQCIQRRMPSKPAHDETFKQGFALRVYKSGCSLV